MPHRRPRSDPQEARTQQRPSKSRLKRESTALQALGIALADAPPELMAGLDLPQRLQRAIDELRGMTKNGAIRRQRQYIGKLMRDVDPEPIRTALAASQRDDATATRRFRTAEAWRDRILREGQPAIGACAAELEVDVAALEEIRARAVDAGSEIRRKTAARELFRTLHRAASADKL